MNGDLAICLPAGDGLFNYRVAGIALQGGKILLHKSETDRFWSLPGGRVDMFEFSAEALAREIMEELNSEVKVGNLVAIAENFFIYQSRQYHEIGFYYLMDIVGFSDFSDKTVVEDIGTLLFRWHDLETFQEEMIYPQIPLRELISGNNQFRHFRFGLEILEEKI